MEATAPELAIAAVLSSVYDMKEAARKLLVGLNAALSIFKTRNREEPERRSTAAQNFTSYLQKEQLTKASSPTKLGHATTSQRPG